MRLQKQRTFKEKGACTEGDLHPRYTPDNDAAFVKELYRLKGFAYLRNQQKMVSMHGNGNEQGTEDQLYIVKAASNFQKALGPSDGQVIHKLYNKMRKSESKKKSYKLVDEEYTVKS